MLKDCSKLTNTKITTIYDLPRLANTLETYGQFDTARSIRKWYKLFINKVDKEYGDTTYGSAYAKA